MGHCTLTWRWRWLGSADVRGHRAGPLLSLWAAQQPGLAPAAHLGERSQVTFLDVLSVKLPAPAENICSFLSCKLPLCYQTCSSVSFLLFILKWIFSKYMSAEMHNLSLLLSRNSYINNVSIPLTALLIPHPWSCCPDMRRCWMLLMRPRQCVWFFQRMNGDASLTSTLSKNVLFELKWRQIWGWEWIGKITAPVPLKQKQTRF